MRLFDRKIKIDNEEFWLTIDKWFYNHVSGDDHYKYECNLYKEVKTFFGIRKKKIYSYETYWLDYFKYHGDIDKVIEETISKYKKNLSEQKYICEKENCFKSKYEV